MVRKYRFIRVYEKDYQDLEGVRQMFIQKFPEFDSANLSNAFMFKKLMDHWFGKI